jgi:branched-chain amino acid transport system permease protein
VYAAIALAVVLTYRGTGVVNFGYGAMAMYPAYVYGELRIHGDLVLPAGSIQFENAPMSLVPALALSPLVAMIIGVLAHYLVFHPLRHAPSLAKVVAGVGLLVVFQAVVVLRFGRGPHAVAPILPVQYVDIFGLRVPGDRLYLAGLVVATILWWLYRYTVFGLASRAAFENERARRCWATQRICWVG